MKVNSFQIDDVPHFLCLGGAEGIGIEAMFARIPVACLASAPPSNLCLVCDHVSRNLTRGIWLIGVAASPKQRLAGILHSSKGKMSRGARDRGCGMAVPADPLSLVPDPWPLTPHPSVLIEPQR